MSVFFSLNRINLNEDGEGTFPHNEKKEKGET